MKPSGGLQLYVHSHQTVYWIFYIYIYINIAMVLQLEECYIGTDQVYLLYVIIPYALVLDFWGRKKLLYRAHLSRQFKFLASLPQCLRHWWTCECNVGSPQPGSVDLTTEHSDNTVDSHVSKTSNIVTQFIPISSLMEPFWLFSQHCIRGFSPAAQKRKAPNVFLKRLVKLMWLILCHQENDTGMNESQYFFSKFLNIQSSYGVREQTLNYTKANTEKSVKVNRVILDTWVIRPLVWFSLQNPLSMSMTTVCYSLTFLALL